MALIRNSDSPAYPDNLPTNTNYEDISEKYEEGILRLSIAKKNQPEAKLRKSIDIK